MSPPGSPRSSTDHEALFQKYYEKGYDIFDEEYYVAWLHHQHPESVPTSMKSPTKATGDISSSCSDDNHQHSTSSKYMIMCNAPINVMPHLPQVRQGWGHIGVLHQLISKVLTLGATL